MRLNMLFLASLLVGSAANGYEDVQLTSWTSPPYWLPQAAAGDRGEAKSADGRAAAPRVAAVAAPVALPFISLPPCRLVDTRGNGAPLTGGFLPAATARSYTLAGVCNVPSNAQAISLNATVVKAVGPGFLVLYPEGGTFPPVSTLNFLGNDTIVNAAVVPLSVTGGITIALGVSGGDVILDTNGYYAPQTVVSTLNGATGDLTLAAGSNVTITPAGSTLTIAATGGGVTLAGSGSAATASHSDHNHLGAFWSGPGFLTISTTDSSNPALHAIAQQWGVHGTSNDVNPNSAGVLGETLKAGGNGVFGLGGPGTGVKGTSTGSNGVYGQSSGSGASGVYGEQSAAGFGVAGRCTSGTASCIGVYGEVTSFSGDVAVFGSAPAPAKAGSFQGDVSISGSLSKGGGSFKIDHPLDPENKYLYHSFVESPDMMNIYNGVAVLDSAGTAWVDFPDWFDSLNRDFRYQLTAIGGPQPGLHVAEELAHNRFRIGGGSPAMKVSWQVTGIRRDAWANAHRIPVEEAKPESDRGRFLHPKEHARPMEDGIGSPADTIRHAERTR